MIVDKTDIERRRSLLMEAFKDKDFQEEVKKIRDLLYERMELGFAF